MKEEKRRRIARSFLEESFGKRGIGIGDFNGQYFPVMKFFELTRDYDSMLPGTWEARAFKVDNPPYSSEVLHSKIAVAETKEELDEIIKLCFDPWYIEHKLVHYATDYKGCKIAYV